MGEKLGGDGGGEPRSEAAAEELSKGEVEDRQPGTSPVMVRATASGEISTVPEDG